MYCCVETEFKNTESLILALQEINPAWKNNIEFFDEPQSLIGYKGDERPEVANIIIRRKHIGLSSNDIGFIRKDGKFSAIISEYDCNYMKLNDEWLGKLKAEYAYRVIEKQQRAKGRFVTRERLENGKQRLTIKGIR